MVGPDRGFRLTLEMLRRKPDSVLVWYEDFRDYGVLETNYWKTLSGSFEVWRSEEYSTERVYSQPDGKVSFAYSRFLGLDKDKETGKIVVNPEQAEVVKLIFRLFLEGMTPHSIAAELTSRGIKTLGGKDVWNQQTVRRMLSNEKYKGDALLRRNSR